MLPAHATLASVAQYYRIGLLSGLCTLDEVRSWAIGVIGALDAPPGEIIEVSWRKPLKATVEDLRHVPGEADLQVVRAALCQRLLQNLEHAPDDINAILRQALHVARAIGNDDLANALDGIDDQLSLAQTGAYGTESECRMDLVKTLAMASSWEGS